MSLIAGKEMTLDGSNVMYHRERVEAWARGERVAPIFLDVASGKTGAELNIEVKNKISHRGLALQQLLNKIKLL